ncbi:MAG: hypothetical protein SFV81_24305 [Pirellulaceae bacterium]|nr:hypothetical protein [Pirellulaceae bacterium]
MLLGLTILLVLLAWTLGNTIVRSTDRSTLDAHTVRSQRNSFVLRAVMYLRSKRSTKMSCAIEMLRHLDLQPALATSLPLGDVVVPVVATTSSFSESSAALIGRNLVGYSRHPSFTARDGFESTRHSLLHLRGMFG